MDQEEENANVSEKRKIIRDRVREKNIKNRGDKSLDDVNIQIMDEKQ